MNFSSVFKLGLVAGLFSTSVMASDLSTERDRISYMVGMDMATQLLPFKDDIDTRVMLEAIDDALAGRDARLSQTEALEIRQAFIGRLQARAAEQRQAAATTNREAGEKFLAENGQRAEVTTTASGLQYEVLRNAEGPKPAATDRVTVHYRGTLLDGTPFDSSYDRGQPATFPLNGVIPGWTEALQLMPVGSQYKLYIPSALAYGERGSQGAIGPNATLVFEVELLEIAD